jgi:hypothetical protein
LLPVDFVITLTRSALTLICALGMARSVVRAQLPTWRISGALETAVGHKDNVLLSHADEGSSAFARSRAEIFVFNVPDGPLDFSLLGNVSGSRYFSSITVDDQTVDHEASAWLNVEPGYRLGDQLKFSLPLLGYYRDEVLDVSNTDVNRRIAAWKLWGANIAPTLRWTFHPAWWVEASASGDRSRYDDHSEDSRLGGGDVRLNWQPTSRIDVRLTGTRTWRKFDTRAQYNAAGFEVVGTQLKVARREAELRIDVAWFEAKHWKTTTRVSALDYRDNGSGFFNYRQKGVSQEIKWETERWLALIEGRASRLSFDVQTVGIGFAPPPLLKEQYDAEIRLERTLSTRWTVFAGYTWERRRSNDPIESYIVNEGLLGLRWSWVK